MYLAEGNWKEANHGEIIQENQVTDDMLWGWDATESSATKDPPDTVSATEAEGSAPDQTTYVFSAAAYRSFDNEESLKKISDKEKLYIKFGFKIWGEGTADVIKKGESKFFMINALSAI